jgi:hypothetical protein
MEEKFSKITFYWSVLLLVQLSHRRVPTWETNLSFEYSTAWKVLTLVGPGSL